MEGDVIGGYEYQFVNTPHERYICQICIHPCRDAYLSGCCGHNLCKSCLDRVKVIFTSCPLCQSVEFATLPNRQADREIRSLYVMCTNKERGCDWQGKINDISNHLGSINGCQFEDVKCFNKCGNLLQRGYLTSHVCTGCPRCMVDCQHCHITGKCGFIQGEHRKVCPKLPLFCPNKCEIGCEDMEAHRKECPLEMVQCEYHNVGCEERIMRKRKRDHEEEKMNEHLLMTKLKLSKTEHELEATKAKLCSTFSTLSETEDKLASNEAKLVSAEIRLGSLEVMLHRLINNTGNSNSLIESTRWCSHLTTLAMKIHGVTQVCPVIIKVPNFVDHKMVDDGWYSEPFYTHSRGYKMCLCVYPAGVEDTEDPHLSVYLYLMKGPHDDDVIWPLTGKFEIILINQMQNNGHHSRSIFHDNHAPRRSACRVTGHDRAIPLDQGIQSLFPIKTFTMSPPHASISKMTASFLE